MDAKVRADLDAAAKAAATAIGRPVDLQVDVLADLLRVGAVRFQHTVPLAGRDVRDRVPRKPLDAFARDAVASARRQGTSLRAHYGRPTDFPLGPPNPDLEFRGYELQKVFADGEWVSSSKRLVTNVLGVATALIAARGRYVLNKHEVPARYRDAVGDAWSDFVDEIYRECRLALAYRLPASPAERQRLTPLCTRATDFENQLMRLP